MESSEDDMPIRNQRSNGVKSAATIPASLDKQLDKEVPNKTNGAISIRHGPVEEMDVDRKNGHTNGKRKSRPSNAKSYKESSDSEDDIPLNKRRKTQSKDRADSDSDEPIAKKKAIKKPPKVTAAQVGESDSDEPITKKLAKEKAEIERKAAITAKEIRKKEKEEEEESDDEDEPIIKKKKKQQNKVATITKPVKGKVKQEAKVKQEVKVKSEPKSTPKKPSSKVKTQEDEDAEAEEDEYKWWEDPANQDDSIKWNTLEHNGVVFPPAYQPLPSNVKLKYDGVPVTLHVDAEEVATFYGGMLNSTVNVTNPTFNKNFFHDFQAIVEKTGGAKGPDGKPVKIKTFEKCDFNDIFDWFEAERARKKAMTTAEKKALKAEKDKAEEPYLYCKWDGRKEKVGNFRVEPPGLFRGRGEHPKTGHVKKRVMPEQITINIGKGAKIPSAPPGHKWKEVKHDQTGTWLAMWQENINGNYKYVMLAANSSVKGQSDHKKFEKARELKKHIDKIRKDYTKDLKTDVMVDRQRATAIYLIDRLALRAGNEKGEDEAETVGCCSLKYEHVTLKPPNIVVFDFLGKDSIRYHDEVEVDAQVFKNLRIFRKEPKGPGDDIFDRLTTASLNKHLQSYMPGLTAKVFRTYNASWTMATLLKDMQADEKATVNDKMKFYNDANRKVAILCNHKRTVGAAHEVGMEKLQNRVDLDRYHQWRLKQMLVSLDSKQKKKHGSEYFARPEDLDQEAIEKLQKFEIDTKREAIERKFKRDSEKEQADNGKPLPDKELKSRLEDVEALEKLYRKENKTGKVEVPENKTVDKVEKEIERLEAKIDKLKHTATEKEDNKEIALGTSKINYIDPRLSVVFCKKFNVPIERIFSKTLREKFDWAIKMVDENWEF